MCGWVGPGRRVDRHDREAEPCRDRQRPRDNPQLANFREGHPTSAGPPSWAACRAWRSGVTAGIRMLSRRAPHLWAGVPEFKVPRGRPTAPSRGYWGPRPRLETEWGGRREVQGPQGFKLDSEMDPANPALIGSTWGLGVGFLLGARYTSQSVALWAEPGNASVSLTLASRGGSS
jgi:hypothetical protein